MRRETLNIALSVVVGGFMFAIGLVVSRILFQLIGVNPPRMLSQAGEAVAGYYLLTGSIGLAAGMVLSSRGIRGTLLLRWLVLSTFLFIGFGVSSTIESSIYSSSTGVLWMIPILLLPSLFLAGTETALFKPSLVQPSPSSDIADPVSSRTWIHWILRGLAAIAAFPLVYFIFGLIVAPVVSQYYNQGVSGLTLPEPRVIVSTQVLRGILHLLAALPIIVLWRGSKRELVLALAMAFFVFVATYDVVLAYQVPIVLVVIHGIEVMVDSLVYSWLLVWLLAGQGAGKEFGKST